MRESRGKESAGEGFGVARYESSSSPTRSRVCAGVVFSKREARSLDVLLLSFFDPFHWRCLFTIVNTTTIHTRKRVYT